MLLNEPQKRSDLLTLFWRSRALEALEHGSYFLI